MQVAWTALHKASDDGNAASVEVLLKQEGVDVNARDEVIELTRLGRDAFSRPPRIPCRAAAPLFTALLYIATRLRWKPFSRTHWSTLTRRTR